MARTSNPTTVSITSTLSALGTLAASMASNTWSSSFTMGGMSESLLNAGGSASILEWSCKAIWDPERRRMAFWGCGHLENDKLIRWDDATNQWSLGPDPGLGGGGQFAHGYYHNAINPSNGDHFIRLYNSAQIIRLTATGTSWGSVASHPNTAQQVASGIEWHPGLNGGAGGLVFCDTLSISISNPTVTSWTTPLSSGSAIMGPIHNWIAAAGGVVYCGGGNNSSAMFRVNANGTVTQLPNTPVQMGIPPGTSTQCIAHPNGQHLLAFSPGTNGAVRLFDGSSWSTIGNHQLGNPTWYIATAIPVYGVVLFVAQPNSGITPFIRVYKA